MSEPFLGEVKIVSFAFAPRGWAACDGQLLPINQNQALFALLGTMYGGNGQTTFALPDLRGKVPMHMSSSPNHTQGETAGSTAVTLNIQSMPMHAHQAIGTQSSGTTPIPTGMVLGNANLNAYSSAGPLVAIPVETLDSVGGSQPHNNMSPYLALNFCIALVGIFPSRN